MGTRMMNSTTTIHTPSRNFTITKMSTTLSESTRREAVDDELVLPAPFAQAQVVLDHAGTGHREAGEDADRVDADEDVHLGVGPDEQRLGGDGEDDDPVGEHEPVATAGELAGQEGVLGDEAREVREAVEARVAARPEDEHRGALHEVEAELAEPGRAEDVLRLLGEHRRACRTRRARRG